MKITIILVSKTSKTTSIYTITSFVNLLSVLEQNRQITWQDILGTVEIKPDINPDLDLVSDDTDVAIPITSPADPADAEESLASFKL